ncbi:MAG: substrate-binding domain-containing protein [Cyanobacteria bacterium SBLK]|nr:substrate-binding domain-containing protein [Cyanobacteria bacterium SBLK]
MNMKSNIIKSLMLCFVLSLLQSCGSNASRGNSSATEQEPKLIITGSSTIGPLVSEMGKRFEAQNPKLRVDIQTGGSSRGLSDTAQGLADIGMVSRGLKEGETEGRRVFTIALDGVSPIVNADNSLIEIDRQQVIDIYTGKIANWQAITGRDAPITVVNKSEGHSTLELFLQHFQLEPEQVEATVIIGDNQQGIKTIAGNVDAIGYVSIGAASYSIEQGVPIKLLKLDGVEAKVDMVIDGSFPLSRPLNLVTQGNPNPLAEKFLDFVLAEENHDLIREQNFVPPKN